MQGPQFGPHTGGGATPMTGQGVRLAKPPARPSSRDTMATTPKVDDKLTIGTPSDPRAVSHLQKAAKAGLAWVTALGSAYSNPQLDVLASYPKTLVKWARQLEHHAEEVRASSPQQAAQLDRMVAAVCIEAHYLQQAVFDLRDTDSEALLRAITPQEAQVERSLDTLADRGQAELKQQRRSFEIAQEKRWWRPAWKEPGPGVTLKQTVAEFVSRGRHGPSTPQQASKASWWRWF